MERKHALDKKRYIAGLLLDARWGIPKSAVHRTGKKESQEIDESKSKGCNGPIPIQGVLPK
jgi:hypothetical protein